MRWLRHPAAYWVVSIGLGAVFIYASLDKIAHPLDFARIVYRCLIVPDYGLPELETDLVDFLRKD